MYVIGARNFRFQSNTFINRTQGSFGALQATKPNSKPASPQLSNRRSANRKKSVAYSPKRRSKFDNSNAFAAFDSLLNEVVHEEVDESEIDEKKAIEAATIAAAKVMGKDFVSNSADVREKQWGGVVSRPLVKAEITKGKKSDSSRSDETFEDYKLTRPLQKQFSTIHE